MTELDEELGPIAAETIEEFGKSVTLTFAVAEEPGYNTATGKTILDDPPDPKSVKAIVEDSSAKGLVQGASNKLTIAAFGLQPIPDTSTTATFNGTTYSVLNVETIFSGELACLYILHVGHI